MRRAIGSAVVLGFVIYLFVKGALVMRPRETISALSALLAALVHACSGSTSTAPSLQDRAPLEESRERDLVRDRQGDEGGEGHVDPGVLDHAEVLGVQSGQLGGILLGQLPFLPELPKPKAETALGCFYGLLEGGSKAHL